MKSEPDDCSIEDALASPEQTESWTGVRNYQARNFIRDDMKIGDGVLFYHSSCPQPGIAGLAKIVSKPYPDPLQFNRQSRYFDPKSDQANPRWLTIDIQATDQCELIALKALRDHKALADMVILRRGNRLSITPVTAKEWQYIKSHLVKRIKR